MTSRWLPVPREGPPGVSALTSGETHAVKLITEDEVFTPGSRVWKLATVMGWRFPHALGVCSLLWHSSQAAEVSRASRDDVLTFCGELSKSERTRLLDALTLCAIISECEAGLYLIHGNDHHITAKKVNSTVQRNRALERWKKVHGATSQDDAGGMPAVSQRYAGRNAAASASAEQSGAVQSGAEQSGSKIPQTPALAPEKLTEEAHTEVEARPSLPPLTNSLAEITASQVTTASAAKLFEVYQDAREKHCQIQRSLIPGGLDLTHCKTLITMCGGDEKAASAIVRAFTKNKGVKNFWHERKWALWILVEPRNFEHARALAAEVKQKAPMISAST